ncbi:MAG: FAD-binding oxidoreductase [Verrucomicrobia bacterium]|nr:FAD-binding oxidoreductase [Verrucomicrobiota bacterium]
MHQPTNVQQLTAWLAGAQARGEKMSPVDLRALSRVIEYTPEDMTVTVEAGITLAGLQAQLAQRGQWLPMDPPNPQNTTISDILNANLSGPRRFGYGTIRDHLLGIKVALAGGRVIKSGGKVVKNVAGYDLQKLFIGSRGSLGVIVEATFKLRPLPEVEQFVQARRESLDQASKLIETVMASELTPVVFDLHKLSTLNPQPATILGFAGTREEVEWQLVKARELGFGEPATLDYEKSFWAEPSPANRLSVLPSRTVEAIRGLGKVAVVARAGNGVICYRGGTPPPMAELPTKLLARIKDAYDPKHIFPDFPT